jgi:general secretion pathway protein I
MCANRRQCGSNHGASFGPRPDMTHIGRRNEAGFTLIEVLAALIIVALGMLGVIQAVGQTASNSSYLRDKTIAHWIAMNRLTETRLQRNPPKIDKSSDEVEMAGRLWRWTMEVTETEVQSLRRIDVRVRFAEDDEESSLASLTGFYGAAVAPPGSTPGWRDEVRNPSGQPGQSGEQGGEPRAPGTENGGRGGNPPPGTRVDVPVRQPPDPPPVP